MAKRERESVGKGGPPRKKQDHPGGWNAAFLWGLLAVAVAVVVFLVVVAGAFSGSSDAKTATTDTPGTTRTTEPPTAVQSENSASPTPAKSATSSATKPVETATQATAGGDDSPLVACGDTQAPVDKQHRLPADCVPSGLVQLPAAISAQGAQYLKAETANAIADLFDAARKAGFNLAVNSGYRSYQNQVDTYNYWVRTSGQAYADRTSAKPGHSEHQLGTTADVGYEGHFLEDFTGTPAAAWLRENSWKFGFIVSYPEGKEAITGYAPEAWHIRFVGKDVAAKVHSSGLTLHEYLLQ
ncbi:MAG: M15 family metallopeptidase [Dehalococcoidia bacterium]|nr:M15 family metallopeptidase [Dehalococcoidia bacterium]